MNTCKGKQKRKTMNFPKERVNVKDIKTCMSELKGHNSLRQNWKPYVYRLFHKGKKEMFSFSGEMGKQMQLSYYV